MRYEGIVYRPPSEADSLIIQATIGCPHNKCNFCGMYKRKKFRIRPVEEIKEDLDMAKDYYGESVKRVFFADGNTILMKTDQLIEIFDYTRRIFPYLDRITLYGSAQYILLKTVEELKSLRHAGLTRLHSGMESGDDEVLSLISKGSSSAGIIKAGQMVKSAGIELSEYYMVGVGGKSLSYQHAVNSARALNEINADFIRLRTFIPFPRTPMYDMYKKGEFELVSPHEALEEMRLLLQNLNGIDSVFLTDHSSNYCYCNGRVREDKEKMLKEIEHTLTLDESRFRKPDEGSL